MTRRRRQARPQTVIVSLDGRRIVLVLGQAALVSLSRSEGSRLMRSLASALRVVSEAPPPDPTQPGGEA